MQLEQLDGQLEAADFQQLLNEDPTLALVLYALSHLTGHWLPQTMILIRICLVFDSKVTVYTHTHTLTITCTCCYDEINESQDIKIFTC